MAAAANDDDPVTRVKSRRWPYSAALGDARRVALPREAKKIERVLARPQHATTRHPRMATRFRAIHSRAFTGPLETNLKTPTGSSIEPSHVGSKRASPGVSEPSYSPPYPIWH